MSIAYRGSFGEATVVRPVMVGIASQLRSFNRSTRIVLVQNSLVKDMSLTNAERAPSNPGCGERRCGWQNEAVQKSQERQSADKANRRRMCWKCLEDEKGCWPHVALHDRLQHCQHRYRAAPLKTGRCVGLLNITLDGIDEVTGNSPSL
jgi:hypothetical protein